MYSTMRTDTGWWVLDVGPHGHSGGILQFKIFGCYMHFFGDRNRPECGNFPANLIFMEPSPVDTNVQEVFERRANRTRETHWNALMKQCTISIAMSLATLDNVPIAIFGKQQRTNHKKNRLRWIVATQRPRECNITEFHCISTGICLWRGEIFTWKHCRSNEARNPLFFEYSAAEHLCQHNWPNVVRRRIRVN